MELPDEIVGDFETVRQNLRTSKGGLGALALEFAIRKLKAGELISLNGKLVPASLNRQSGLTLEPPMSSPDHDNVMELRLPADQFRDVATAVLKDALERGGIAEAIRQAAMAALAMKGMLEKEHAAKYLGIEVRTLELWMKPVAEGGKGVPHLKIDKTVRFRIEALDAWSAKFEVNPVARRLAA